MQQQQTFGSPCGHAATFSLCRSGHRACTFFNRKFGTGFAMREKKAAQLGKLKWRIKSKKNSLSRLPFLDDNERDRGPPFRFANAAMGLSGQETLNEEPIKEVFSGLGDTQNALEVCETQTLPAVLSLAEARDSLLSAINDLEANPSFLASGIMRFQIPVPPEIRALQWLQSQPQCTDLLPRFYFSSRGTRGESSRYGDIDQEDRNVFNEVAGVGCAVLFKGLKSLTLQDWRSLKRFLSNDSPLIRAYGAIRFNVELEPSTEWRSFGSFYFLIPQIEFCNYPSGSLLALTVAWDNALGWAFNRAVDIAKETLVKLSDEVASGNNRPHVTILEKTHVPSENEWHDILKRVLETLDYNESVPPSQQLLLDPSKLDRMGLSKVVMARRTKLDLGTVVEPLNLLASLQEKDPDAYQFCIQTTDTSTFIGSTPERLFYRNGLKVVSEAVAATRARGITGSKDFQSSVDLLLSTKDHLEFDIVQESIKRHMEMVCKHVEVESHKGLIKQANVQHLYASLIGELHSEDGELELLSTLHPTPAVCGQPQWLARNVINDIEGFDRGMYAGPIGWIGGDQAEFAVGIRSSLVEPCRVLSSTSNDSKQVTRLYLYAGVGIVQGTKSYLEWRELDLKISQFESMLRPSPPLPKAVNLNALWANIIVEECCRLGVTYFCIAPGSRSSPLAVAAAENSRVICVSCIDERSLAYHALGYGRGACRPAAVITSSGTAVSNLLPAVVEASQDCVPILLLTADRPPELQDAGANQSIDQGQHFGSFVRYNFNLPPASDKVKARMVLTTLDTAIYRATTEPFGPVHLNIAFREPLAGIPDGWNQDCLQGLDAWALGSFPFTKYIKHDSLSVDLKPYGISSQLKEVVSIISKATRGLLIVGGLHLAEEAWAAMLLAEFLGWPVVSDILSGLRLRQAEGTGYGKRNLYMIDNFDHILLSSAAWESISPDVVLQIGSRFTSNRLGQFLEFCQPFGYILVEEHPYRHDPSHLLTHRVQSSVIKFAAVVRGVATPSQPQEFIEQLQLLSNVVGREIQFQLHAESSLTEPSVAQIVAKSMVPGSALFLGNSMAIRDVDMYAEGTLDQKTILTDLCDSGVSTLGIRTAGNRGASGIDGVLSTAIGFAVGSRRRVTLLVGDVSFLHDTNGLTLLTDRVGQPPVTVVVMNNFGGGIFSLLPISHTAPAAAFAKYFSTPHDVSIRQLCVAHRVNHMFARSKEKMEEALSFVQCQQLNWVIEAQSNIEENAEFHRFLQSSVLHALNRALQLLYYPQNKFGLQQLLGGKIQTILYCRYRFSLSAYPTTKIGGTMNKERNREGFLLQISLSNGLSGFGEVAPLEGLHEEDMVDVEEQLRILVQVLKGMKLNAALALLNGSFSDWLSKHVGLLPNTLCPSVRCGLEMAVLGALATTNGCSIVELLHNHATGKYIVKEQNTPANKGQDNRAENGCPKVRVCALIDSDGTPEDVATSAYELVKQGFCTLKIKVARRASPLDDAAVLLAVRRKVGPNVNIRADANQRWTFAQALEFAEAVRSCGLQYLEEPLGVPEEIPKFCRESGLPVALDESIDKYADNFIQKLTVFAHPGVVAVVIKPASVGGFERAALIAKWAQRQGMIAVVSAAFESSISLAAYAQFAAYVDRMRLQEITSSEADKKRLYQQSIIPPVAHGLGTYMWLGSDIIKGNKFLVKSVGEGVEAFIEDAADLFQNIEINMDTVKLNSVEAEISSHLYTIQYHQSQYSFHVLDTGRISQNSHQSPVLVFLHGFLGIGEDWLPLMHALSTSCRCIAVDLPGHGKTTVDESSLKRRKSDLNRMKNCNDSFSTVQVEAEDPWSMENIAEALSKLFQCICSEKVILIGYSMGARLALHIALRCKQQISAAVSISGSPGLQDPAARAERARRDDALAAFLQSNGLQSFVESWYKKPLWKSLRRLPRFKAIEATRMQHKDLNALAKVLSALSSGRQQSLWDDLAQLHVPLLLVVGNKDKKFQKIAHLMCGIEVEQPLNPWAKMKSIDGFTDTMLPSFDGFPKDEGFMSFVDQEMKKFQLEEALALDSEIHKTTKKTGKERFRKNDSYFTLLEVNNSGHAVHLENPLDLIKGIRKFVGMLNITSY